MLGSGAGVGIGVMTGSGDTTGLGTRWVGPETPCDRAIPKVAQSASDASKKVFMA